MYVHNNVKQRHFKTQITMSNQVQNKLFNYIISNSEIDDIQSRFISYKLELNKVENIIQIEMIKEHNFNFHTDNGSFKVTTVNVPLPISSVVRNK
jgi:hypothetical protein